MVSKPATNDSGLDSIGDFGVEVLDVDTSIPLDTGWLMSMLNSDAFHQLPPENLHLLAGKMTPVNVAKGDSIITQGEHGDYYYVIREGGCHVLHNGIKINELGPLDCFGEEALISGNPRNATIVMISNGVLMRLSKQDFAELLIPPMILKVSVAEAVEKARDGAILLDVRTRDEYKIDRLGRSINIPLSILRMKFNKLKSRNKKPLIVYCDTGARSSAACFLLKQAGLDVFLLDNPQKAFHVMKAKKQSDSTTTMSLAPMIDEL